MIPRLTCVGGLLLVYVIAPLDNHDQCGCGFNSPSSPEPLALYHSFEIDASGETL